MLATRLADNSEMVRPPPDYTLDYGYEGGASDADEEVDGEFRTSVTFQPNSSFRNPSVRSPPPFGDAFEELEKLPDEFEDDDYDEHEMYEQ